jgi:hypothetical protein
MKSQKRIAMIAVLTSRPIGVAAQATRNARPDTEQRRGDQQKNDLQSRLLRSQRQRCMLLLLLRDPGYSYLLDSR